MKTAIPDIDEIEVRIQRLKNYKFPTYSEGKDINLYCREIQHILGEELGFSFNFHFPSIGNISPESVRIFRARYTNEITNPFLKSEHGYPPPSFCTKLQRANLPYHPVLYCSDSPRTAMHELVYNHPEAVGKMISISAWRLDSFNLLQRTIYILDNLHPQSPYQEIGESFFEKSLKLYNHDLLKGELEFYRRIIKFYGEAFVDNNSYILSSHLAHQCLYQTNSALLIYPSVQNRLFNVNFAIHPNIFDSHMNLDIVYNARIKEFSEKEFRCTLTLESVLDNTIKTKGTYLQLITIDDPRFSEYIELFKSDLNIK